jgi:hypothetical protein
MMLTLEQWVQARALLEDRALHTREVWVHDYTERCYRETPGYTLNGLHWGYPEGLAQDVLGLARGHYATFVRPEDALVKDGSGFGYANNSRFSRVLYGEIAEIVVRGVDQKIDQIKKDQKAAKRAERTWILRAAKRYSQYRGAALRLYMTRGGTLAVIVLRPDRLRREGGGYDLKPLKKGDISMDRATRDRLDEGVRADDDVPSLTFFSNRVHGIFNRNHIRSIPWRFVKISARTWSKIRPLVRIQP